MTRTSESGERGVHWLDRLHLHPGWLLAIFAVGVVAINFGRWDEWGPGGFRLYLTQAIMQTTLFDFGWVLLIVTLFLHHDARRHDLSQLADPSHLSLHADRGPARLSDSPKP